MFEGRTIEEAVRIAGQNLTPGYNVKLIPPSWRQYLPRGSQDEH
jgi:hypothetical protein